MKVWITKYALTKGIFEIEAEVCEFISPDMIKEVGCEYPTYYHGKGKDWHKTREDAVKRADEIRKKKVVSLRKKIEKLESMIF